MIMCSNSKPWKSAFKRRIYCFNFYALIKPMTKLNQADSIILGCILHFCLMRLVTACYDEK